MWQSGVVAICDALGGTVRVLSFIKLDELVCTIMSWIVLSPALKSVRSSRNKIWAEPQDGA